MAAEAVEARGGPKLLALDRWVHDELPGEVRVRQPRHLMHDELLRVVRWKMGRGVWRGDNPQTPAGPPPGGRLGVRSGNGRGAAGASTDAGKAARDRAGDGLRGARGGVPRALPVPGGCGGGAGARA